MLVICLLAVSAVPRTARAQDDFQRYLTAAVRLYQGLEYERALDQLQRAKQLARGVEQDVAVALHEGIILADMGKREESQAAFKTGLLLSPEAKLPFKVSPKVTRDFEAVKRRVHQELARVPPPPKSTGTDRPEQPAPPNLEAPPPASPSLDVAAVKEPRRSRLPVAPLVLSGVSVAAAGVGAFFGLQSRSNAAKAREAYAGGLPAQPDVSGVRAHLDDARGQARTANVLFGTAVLAAGGALVTYLLASDTSAQEAR